MDTVNHFIKIKMATNQPSGEFLTTTTSETPQQLLLRLQTDALSGRTVDFINNLGLIIGRECELDENGLRRIIGTTAPLNGVRENFTDIINPVISAVVSGDTEVSREIRLPNGDGQARLYVGVNSGRIYLDFRDPGKTLPEVTERFKKYGLE